MTRVATDSAAFSTASAPMREVWFYMQASQARARERDRERDTESLQKVR